ncbi:acyl-CoA dehydrogenase N-terminal domain-containing protein [Micromonospora sp. BRA006-A]|nr:acyl-CoA dehydrogenase N-terminal domain-containing protein [Micromonospora sp. BRA006-A]
MSSSDLLLSRRDLAFLLHDWLDVARLTERPRYAEHTRETVDEVLDLAARVAAERFARTTGPPTPASPRSTGSGCGPSRR